MDVTLLGTGAADGIPAFFGNTRVSQFARENGGKDVRSRCAAIVDDFLKIDLGPDTWLQTTREGLDTRDWIALLVTHSDTDHFSIDELQYAVFPFNDMEFVGFPIYANANVCRRILERYPDWPFELIMTKSFCPIKVSEYKVTPIQANHKHDEDCHNFLIDDGQATMLYGADTGVWFEPSWEFLEQQKLDCLVLECSEGVCATPYNGHLDIREFLAVIERLRRMGTVSDSTIILTTHHSHNGGATHDELCRLLEPHGVTVGFDGLKITF